MIHGHGDDIFKFDGIRMNFSSNVPSFFCHDGLFRHLTENMQSLTHYPVPVPTELENKIAQMNCVDSDNVMFTNGATEAIYMVSRAFECSHSAILVPTFSEYADACVAAHHTVDKITDLREVTDQHQMVWICNPNNPTGGVIPVDLLMDAIESHPNTIFVIDASYEAFSDKSLLSQKQIIEFPNVIMINSLTKRFAVPGLRLGYLTVGKDITEKIFALRMPWSVNQMSIFAASYLLDHKDEYPFDIHALLSETAYLANGLAQVDGIKVLPSDCHFFLARTLKSTAAELKEFLAKEHGVLIRNADNFDGLDSSYFRVSVQSRKDNDELIRLIGLWSEIM